MKQRLAIALCAAACRVLPAPRKRWADAMIAELPHADGDRAALVFAGGCLLAALRERVRDIDTRFAAALWSIAVATALFAVLRLACAARGIEVLLGASDGMHDALAQHGASAALMASYEASRPIVVGCFLGLGGAQVAAAWFLSRRQIYLFMIAWCVALVVASVAVAIQLSVVWTLDGVPSEFHAALMQAVTVPMLFAWLHRQKNRSRSA